MIAADFAPRAIFGGLLWGDRPVRYVFVDEAGTSALEPVTIVVGLVVHADKQLMMAEAAVNEVLGAVPLKFRDGFIFHATDIWGSAKYRNDWAMADRLALLHAMMGLPRRLGIPIALGMARRDSEVPEMIESVGLTPAQWHHLHAFNFCLCMADKYIRDYADLQEVATVVAEDVVEMRKFLAFAPRLLRESPFVFGPNALKRTEVEVAAGYQMQESDMRVTRIRPSIHFVQKEEDPMIQLSDACAFGVRRFFAGQEFGDKFITSILGAVPPIGDYSGPASGKIFYNHPRKA